MTSTVESPDWTLDDRALLLALAMHEAALCPGCGKPIDVAWHSHTDGWWETAKYVCYSCTAADEGDEKVAYSITSSTMPNDQVLPPFLLDVTTESP